MSNLYVALLRGINVGGHNKIKMQDFRSLLEELGFTDAQTYVQSGNAVFRTRKSSPAKLAARIHDALKAILDKPVPVAVRTSDDWRQIAKSHPFMKKDASNIGHLAVTFCHEKPKQSALKQLKAQPGIKDQLRAGKQEVYLYLPDGTARTKLNINFFEKQLGVDCTSRNWKTVAAIKEILQQVEQA